MADQAEARRAQRIGGREQIAGMARPAVGAWRREVAAAATAEVNRHRLQPVAGDALAEEVERLWVRAQPGHAEDQRRVWRAAALRLQPATRQLQGPLGCDHPHL